ncbi:MAG TPA: outer membrane beta-barrel protein [Steroidobacteraceae bacterium]
MKTILAWMALGVSALLSGTAMAQGYGTVPGPIDEGLYIGASAGGAFYNEDGIPQLTPTVAMFRIGQQFNPYLAIEGRIGTSVNGGRADGFHADLNALYAGYVKGMLPISPWFSGYAIAGLGGAQIHRNYPDFNTNDAGLSYGVGTQFNMGGGASLNVEWTRLINNGSNDGFGYTTDLLTFGVNWHPYFW